MKFGETQRECMHHTVNERIHVICTLWHFASDSAVLNLSRC